MFNDGINKIEVYGEKPCIAINQSIEETIIVEKISKLGYSIYSINKIDIDLDKNLFIPIKEINELRRTAIEKLNNERLKAKVEFKKVDISFNKTKEITTNKLSL